MITLLQLKVIKNYLRFVTWWLELVNMTLSRLKMKEVLKIPLMCLLPLNPGHAFPSVSGANMIWYGSPQGKAGDRFEDELIAGTA